MREREREGEKEGTLLPWIRLDRVWDEPGALSKKKKNQLPKLFQAFDRIISPSCTDRSLWSSTFPSAFQPSRTRGRKGVLIPLEEQCFDPLK